jgi:phytoene synthase
MISEDIQHRLMMVDPDRYRSALLADEAGQARLLVIYGFHSELAKIPELVSETMIGEIRYQWWRDAIDEIYSGKTVRAHEITTPLSQLINETALPRFWIDRLIDGRARDLDPAPFADIAAARDYARVTSGVLMQIASFVLNPDFDSDAALTAGEAWGLTGLARSYRYYHTGMLSNLEFNALKAAAKESYQSAQRSLGQISAETMPALAYAANIPAFLKRMSKNGFDPKTDDVSYAPPLKQIRMIRAALRGRL